jgi:hypothetical protein
MPRNNYNDQVFINCPFDEQYVNLFRASIFTILDAGFIPRCSFEVDDATQFRLAAIVKIIRECRYGIHDLSRVEPDARTHLPRFNMPFEFGIFYAAKQFGDDPHKQKKCFIVEKQKYRYQKFISDIAGMDITPHGNTQKKLIQAIRGWLVTASRRNTIPQGQQIYNRFRSFQADMRRLCRQRAIDYDSMPFIELVDNMTDWLRVNQITHAPLFA